MERVGAGPGGGRWNVHESASWKVIGKVKLKLLLATTLCYPGTGTVFTRAWYGYCTRVILSMLAAS